VRKRRAAVFLRHEHFLMHAYALTTAGLWIESDPCLAVAEECEDAELGRAIQAALHGSRLGVPHPRDWNAVRSPFLALAGVKSWNTFSKDAVRVAIEEEDDHVAVIPTKNLGRGGYESDYSKKLLVQPRSPVELGAAARRVLTTGA
jgi:hypothetical protein